MKAWELPLKTMKKLEDRLNALEVKHQRLRLEYDSHLAFGKTGSAIAIGIFLALFAVLIWKIN